MCTYQKNMEGKKLKDLKNKSFDSVQKMFDRAFKRVNTFVDFRTDLVEGSSKRVGKELEQESTKKQKVDEDKDIAELQSLMKIIPDEEEVVIDVVPLEINIKFRGGLLGLKVFLMLFGVTAALTDVNAGQSKLVLLENFNENYSKCLPLLVHRVNAASEEVSTAKLVSTAYMIDYALWEVMENGATLPKTQVVEGVTKVMPITIAEKKATRRLEVKARSTLMMAIPNERQL
ncbi:hypothetical protein Tco_0888803, partial [Tanacetum coccineum]